MRHATVQHVQHMVFHKDPVSVAYISDIPNIISSHDVQYHFCADDTLVYDHCTVSEVQVQVPWLTSCLSDLSEVFASLWLQLNSDSETDFILFGFDSHSDLAKMRSNTVHCRPFL